MNMKTRVKLQPLNVAPVQAVMDNRLQLLHIIEHLLREIGPADIRISTFSTSEEFLRGMYRLKKLKLVKYAVLMADLKAAKKTVQLKEFMANVFDEVYLTENHSKVVLLENAHAQVCVVTSQNQTRGNRTEAACVMVDEAVFDTLKSSFDIICSSRSIRIHDFDG